MVKLIRLSANDTNIIRNDLQTNVIIKKKSKIALLNLSFEKNKLDYEINNTNNEVSYSFESENNIFETTFKILDEEDLPFILNEDTYKEFLTTFEKNLNKSLDITYALALGTIWFVNIDSKTETFSIDTYFMQALNPFNNKYFKQALEPNTFIINPVNGVFGKDSITTIYDNIWGSRNNNVFFPAKGCGMFRATIQGVSSPAQGGFYMGLSKLEVDDFNDYQFTKNNLTYGVQFTNQTENYKYIDLLSDTIQDAGFPPQGGDIISFELSEGNINIVIYTTTHPKGLIISSTDIEDDITGDLYNPCFSFASSQALLNMKDLLLTADDSQIFANELYPNIPEPTTQINKNELILTLPYVGVRDPPVQDDEKRDFIFKFNSLSLAQYLGFNKATLEEILQITFNKKAINSVTFRDQSEAYLVETLNLKLDSYDGLLQQRKDILMLIQNSRERTENDVLFEANNLIYVDINNDFEFSLRNIDIALKKTNYENVDVTGELIMTILIKEENEL